MTDLRKALVSPNEDFVVMVPATNQDKTRIIGEDDLKQIKEEADSLYLKADQAVHARAEEMKRYDEDEDDAEDEDDDELEDEDDGDLNPKMEKAITIMGNCCSSRDCDYHYRDCCKSVRRNQVQKAV